MFIRTYLSKVNSTLDWSPIKWRNKLEQIWNLSLSQGTLIFDTIGEDTIKTGQKYAPKFNKNEINITNL